MFRSYYLRPLQTGRSDALQFEWDSESGDLRGSSADRVRQLAHDAQAVGIAVGHPHPTVYEITDPFRIPGQMAVLLGNEWELPPDLTAAYPEPPDDDAPPGAIF